MRERELYKRDKKYTALTMERHLTPGKRPEMHRHALVRLGVSDIKLQHKVQNYAHMSPIRVGESMT